MSQTAARPRSFDVTLPVTAFTLPAVFPSWFARSSSLQGAAMSQNPSGDSAKSDPSLSETAADPMAIGSSERLGNVRLALDSATLESPSSESVPTPELPDSIPGYKLLRELERGGQGVIYQAIQKSTQRKVAIKVLREGLFAGS